jgi:uncharacterized membrane protein (UPF0127 family)
MRLLRSWVLILVLAPLIPLAARGADLATLAIHTADGQDHPFSVELAATDAERELGLMNRASMPADHGMLFEFDRDQPIYMWMKNTLIPLDMLFIDRTGRIAGIAARAVPLSEEVIASPGSVRAVLELNGGTVERMHIAVGDTVRHPFFKP